MPLCTGCTVHSTVYCVEHRVYLFSLCAQCAAWLTEREFVELFVIKLTTILIINLDKLPILLVCLLQEFLSRRKKILFSIYMVDTVLIYKSLCNSVRKIALTDD